jgi:MYXO-CTERM domain-containing protein
MMFPILLRRLYGPLLTLALAFVAVNASAQGRVVWKKSKLNESSQRWHVDLEFHMSTAPDIAVVPVRFEFTPEVYYERSMVDGKEEPVITRMPLADRQPLVETVDIGFLNPSTGKIEKRTRFSFDLTRDRGFKAGEYKVVVEDKRNGRKLGQPTRLVLNGENEVIDRRSISFDPSTKKKKEKELTEEEKAAMADPPDPNSEEFWEGGPTEADDPNGDTLPPPAHMQERPCACRVPGGQSRSSAWLLGLALMGTAWLARRRTT